MSKDAFGFPKESSGLRRDSFKDFLRIPLYIKGFPQESLKVPEDVLKDSL